MDSVVLRRVQKLILGLFRIFSGRKIILLVKGINWSFSYVYRLLSHTQSDEKPLGQLKIDI